ncbi:MAG TPA: ATP-dependent helicase C-terminal domain-containing protein [Candidatus Acidoferrum sp.]|nr:ATP-dependent helicase C-terminal domain-containing protein [Candidatus Acidoferrum sp.]
MADRLPIYEIESDIIACLKATRRLILQAPTGSGKSTQVPQMLLKHGLLGSGQVVILQPRRLAARLLASRVARELGVELGREVGYQVRFENCVSEATRIKFETEGILLRQLIQDPTLRGIQAVIFDEFHERHLYGDITLARALDIQEQLRPDLLIIVMSATLDADALENYLSRPHPQSFSRRTGEGGPREAGPGEGCAVLRSEGRVYLVDIGYLPRRLGPNPPPVWDLAAEVFAEYAGSAERGDVLVFMPGGFEISQTIEAIRHKPESKGYILLPLHGELSPRDQDAAVARYDQPKVVVATNVAETSITIDGVRLVIDSGLARIPRYDANRGINTLLVEKISQASAEQRAGRAGRTAPGRCVRLWSRPEHDERAPQELPEIKRLDLAEVVLTLKAAGVGDLRQFRWLEKPDEISLTHAEELLEDLGALKVVAQAPPPAGSGGLPAARPDAGQGCPAIPQTRMSALQITPIGRKLLAFPLHPRYSRMLLAAQEYGCVHQACLVAALTQGRDLLLRNVDRDTVSYREDLLGDKASSDFWILMRAWNYAAKNQFRLDACRRLGIHAVTARQVGPLFDQFVRIARDEGLDVTPREIKDEALQKCILIGFSDRVARRLDQGTLRCELVHNRRGVLARESAVQHSPLLVAAEVREVEGREVNTILSLATAIEADWLRELFPEDMKSDLHVEYDAQARRVQAAELLRFRGLALSAKRIDPPPAEAAARLLAEEILAERLSLPNWDHGVEQWRLRLRLLCRHCPELQLPDITEADRKHLIEQLCHGAVSYKDIKEREVKPLVMSWLSEAQRQLLDRHAPERLALPNGRTPKVTYEATGSPHISLRIQELYDVTQTPKIAMGRVPVVVHILTPGMKPVQVTQDLANFWREHYPKIKSELQRKYPKHLWR